MLFCVIPVKCQTKCIEKTSMCTSEHFNKKFILICTVKVFVGILCFLKVAVFFCIYVMFWGTFQLQDTAVNPKLYNS